MSYTIEHSTLVFEDIRVEVECTMQSAEPDVGIMGDYVEDWKIIEVDGDTSDATCGLMEERIIAEMGDQKFVEQLYDEGLGCD